MSFRTIKHFFSSSEHFEEYEWILKYQIFSVLIISFFFGLGVLIFSYFRIAQGNLIVGLSQLFLGLYLLYGFFHLKENKSYYHTYSIWFMILFFSYTAIIFFYVPQNHLNILWVISAPILVFFFLNRTGGVLMFIAVSCFILYLIITSYPYTIAEYVTLIAAFLITSFVMLTYEKVKDGERQRLTLYAKKLQHEVNRQTDELQRLNHILSSRLDEELDKRLSQEQMLLRQYRMASLGEMIDAIAHQWRQPLMNINAVLMNIDRHIDTHNKSGKYLSNKVVEINTLTTHMSKTIDDFRYLFQEEKSKTKISAEKLVIELLSIMKCSLSDISVTIDCNSNTTIYGYKSELIQTMMILLSNALNVLNERNISYPAILIQITHGEIKTVITITDNAGGIEDRLLSKVFEPYFTTQKQQGGSGLGLYIAKIIIEHNMQGTITVQNVKDGACFIINLPR